MIRAISRATCSLAFLCLAAGAATAQSIIAITPGPMQGTYGGGETDGFQFTPVTQFTISALGVWGTTLNVSHEVGLWDSAGTLLASAFVSPSDSPFEGFTFHTLTSPVTVSAGETYVVGAEMFGDATGYECTGACTGDTINPLISNVSALYNSGDTFTFPANPWPHIDWGANFLIGPAEVYMIGNANNVFGTIDPSNGQFTQLGGYTANNGLGELNGTLYTSDDNGSLYRVSPVNGTQTRVGSTLIDVYLVGSTTSGLYGWAGYNLYSVNPTTGAATLIGPTGLSTTNGDLALSAGGDALYMVNNDATGNAGVLYSLSTSTGAATLIGPTGTVGFGAMVFQNGVLYGLLGSSPYSLCTLNTSTGAATIVFPTTQYDASGLAPAGLIPAPLSLTFPGQDVGTTSPDKVVTVANVSPASIAISNIATAGDFASPSNTCSSTLAPGNKCTIKVTFSPTQPSKRSGGLIVTDDAPGSPQTIPLTGTGLQPGAKLTPKTLHFGTQLAGTDGQPQTVTLTNTGNETLNITGIAATPPFSQQSSTCGSTLAAKANCTIFVTFDPSSKGAQTGTVSVADDAPGSPQIVNLMGTGTVVELSPASLSFGSQTVNTTSAAQTVTLTNTGSTALKVTIGIGGTDPGDFGQTNNCGTGLKAGASCTINATFTPTTTGDRSGTVSVTDAGGGSPQTVTLTGTGT